MNEEQQAEPYATKDIMPPEEGDRARGEFFDKKFKSNFLKHPIIHEKMRAAHQLPRERSLERLLLRS